MSAVPQPGKSARGDTARFPWHVAGQKVRPKRDNEDSMAIRGNRKTGIRRLHVRSMLAYVAFLSPALLSAQTTAPVPLEDPSYEVLDRLAAQLPTNLIHGQRPYTRLQFARLTRELGAVLAEIERSAPPERRVPARRR